MRDGWIDQRLDRLDEFAVDTARRFDGVDRRLTGVDRRLYKIEGRLDGVDKRLNLMEHAVSDGFDRIDTDMRELQSQTAAVQRTLIQVSCGALITLFVGFAVVITQL